MESVLTNEIANQMIHFAFWSNLVLGALTGFFCILAFIALWVAIRARESGIAVTLCFVILITLGITCGFLFTAAKAKFAPDYWMAEHLHSWNLEDK